MSLRRFFSLYETSREVNVSFFLKFTAFSLDIVCLSLWLSEKDTQFYHLPAKNRLELTLYFLTIPGHVVVLGGMLWLYLLGSVPSIIIQRAFLTIGYSLFIVCGTLGVVNYLQDIFGQNMFATSILCLCIGVILLVDLLKIEHFFIEKQQEETNVHEEPAN